MSEQKYLVAQDRFSKVLRERIEQDLVLLQRLQSNSRNGHSGITLSDFEIIASAHQFSTSLLTTHDLDEQPFWRGKLRLSNAMTASLMGDWSRGKNATAKAIRDLEFAFEQEPHAGIALSLAFSWNLATCIHTVTGNLEGAFDCANQAEDWSHRILDVKDDVETSLKQDAVWELCLAIRSRAILRAALEREGAVVDAKHSLDKANELFDGLPQTRGLYRWELPQFLIDAWQLLVLLECNAGDSSAAREAAHQAIDELQALDLEIKRIGAKLGHSIPHGKLVRANQFLMQVISGGTDVQRCPEQFPSLDRRSNRTLHTDLLVSSRLPAEFEEQEKICFAWTNEYWSREAISHSITSLVNRVPVHILVPDVETKKQAIHEISKQGVDTKLLSFSVIPTDTIWARDFGPNFTLRPNGNPIILDFINEPRGKRLLDEFVPRKFADEVTAPAVMPEVLLSGGEILTNGDGLLLVSKSMLNRNQASGINPNHALKVLSRLTGAKSIIAVEPLIGEPTAHIDVFATFTDVNSIVIGSYSSNNNPNMTLLNNIANSLKGLETTKGPLKVTRIPMPPITSTWQGKTFTNVVYANGLLLVPTYEDVSTELQNQAIATFRRLMPKWEIQLVRCDDISAFGGALRCISINIPANNASPTLFKSDHPPGSALIFQ